MPAISNLSQPPPPDLGIAIRSWCLRNPTWHSRPAPPSSPLGPQFLTPWARLATRYATPDEVAAEVVNDPAVRQALLALTSPAGEAVEQAVLQSWLPAWQAQLLTAALTKGWRTVLDQSCPAWQRGEVLVGTLAILAVVCLLAWVATRTTV